MDLTLGGASSDEEFEEIEEKLHPTAFVQAAKVATVVSTPVPSRAGADGTSAQTGTATPASSKSSSSSVIDRKRSSSQFVTPSQLTPSSADSLTSSSPSLTLGANRQSSSSINTPRSTPGMASSPIDVDAEPVAMDYTAHRAFKFGQVTPQSAPSAKGRELIAPARTSHGNSAAQSAGNPAKRPRPNSKAAAPSKRKGSSSASAGNQGSITSYFAKS